MAWGMLWNLVVLHLKLLNLFPEGSRENKPCWGRKGWETVSGVKDGRTLSPDDFSAVLNTLSIRSQSEVLQRCCWSVCFLLSFLWKWWWWEGGGLLFSSEVKSADIAVLCSPDQRLEGPSQSIGDLVHIGCWTFTCYKTAELSIFNVAAGKMRNKLWLNAIEKMEIYEKPSV